MGQVLQIVYRVISASLCHQAGFRCTEARTGAVTLIQRFGSALNLNIHFHMLFLDGVYVESHDGKLRFRQIAPPATEELQVLLHRIAHRVARYLERRGLLERDVENSYLSLEGLEEDTGAMPDLYGHSITYRVALGPQRGKKVFSLQSLPPLPDQDSRAKLANEGGFSLHAGVAARADQRDKLERLCRYIARPAVSEKRLSLTANGQVRYQLKTPYRDGTTHVIFNPLDFLARLAALVLRGPTETASQPNPVSRGICAKSCLASGGDTGEKREAAAGFHRGRGRRQDARRATRRDDLGTTFETGF
jgi:hypothetical protein